jgi:hypothetical protein
VGVYVDVLIITGSSNVNIATLKEDMKRSFSMSDLGLLSYYLGIQVDQKQGVTTICQSSYTEDLRAGSDAELQLLSCAHGESVEVEQE